MALKQAYLKAPPTFRQKHSFQFIPIGHKKYQGTFINEKKPIDQQSIETLKIHLANADAICLSLLGDAHTQLGLVNNPQPFDFILDNHDDTVGNSRAQFIPKSLIAKTMKISTKLFINYAETLIGLASHAKPFIQIESPPPIASEEHIYAHPVGFEKKITTLGISPRQLRRKLYLLHGEIIQEYCKKLGIEYLPSPVASKDTQGYLKEKYWATDPSHANAEYGSLVLDDVSRKCREFAA